MKYHSIAFVAGFVLDLLLGDPVWLPHPVRLMGRLITQTEKWLYKKKGSTETKQHVRMFWRGAVLATVVPVCVTAAAAVILAGAYGIHPYVGLIMESIMTYQILAVKCLKDESMRVWQSLKDGSLPQARAAVSMIVGRDTQYLDAEGVTKAAIETVAENASDGVIAPMLYLAAGGPILGFFYKSVNTMDSMVGYKNDTYIYFGRAAAKLDDLVNFIPSRISACLMIMAAFFLPGRHFSGKGAFQIYRRDRRKHASPNSAQTESVCAGALGIQLGGAASYFGKIVKKPYIGDALREVECEDIRRVNCLMYAAAWLCELLCLFVIIQ